MTMSSGHTVLAMPLDGAAERLDQQRRISFLRLPGSTSSIGVPFMRRSASAALGRKLVNLLDQRMADIGAGRAAQLLVNVGLEWQQRQHVIDIAAHGARPARPPRPDRRRDVIHDRDGAVLLADAAGDPMGEIRRVDDDHHIGPLIERSARRSGGCAQDHRQGLGDAGQADDGEIVDAKQRRQPFRRHLVAADAAKLDRLHRASPSAPASARRRAGRRIPRSQPERPSCGWAMRLGKTGHEYLGPVGLLHHNLRLGNDRAAGNRPQGPQGPLLSRHRRCAGRSTAGRSGGPGRAWAP